MPNRRSSRRVLPLQESDIDHEINLVDHSAATQGSCPPSPTPQDVDVGADTGADQPALTTSESHGLLRDGAAPISRTDEADDSVQPGHAATEEQPHPGAADRPQTPHVEPPTPAAEDAGAPVAVEQHQSGNGGRVSVVSSHKKARKHARPKSPEKAIDILYENERGGFLCGIPLFSGAALGNLDPAPWTNELHKPSPTDIKTAQVPDPTWEWSWPSWRVNRDDQIETDEDGWEYSFMFGKWFSWHRPKWYNSFVRRRAWIRQRMKKGSGYEANDVHLLNPDYFTVRSPSPSAGGHSRQGSSIGGEASSNRTSLIASEEDMTEQKIDIPDIQTLMVLLRKSRIDREKLNAVLNYLEHSTDNLVLLQDHMHEIMSIFVFQASRRLLLTRLMETHDKYSYQKQNSSPSSASGATNQVPEPPTIRLQALESADKGEGRHDKPSLPEEPASEGQRRRLVEKQENLAAAIKHADEEVRRLEYWSDVKGMAEGAVSGGAVAEEHGWRGGWDGIDRSGGMGANKEELP